MTAPNKLVIANRLREMEEKLATTKETAAGNRGPLNDALQVVIPIFEEQVEIMRAINDRIAL